MHFSVTGGEVQHPELTVSLWKMLLSSCELWFTVEIQIYVKDKTITLQCFSMVTCPQTNMILCLPYPCLLMLLLFMLITQWRSHFILKCQTSHILLCSGETQWTWSRPTHQKKKKRKKKNHNFATMCNKKSQKISEIQLPTINSCTESSVDLGLICSLQVDTMILWYISPI